MANKLVEIDPAILYRMVGMGTFFDGYDEVINKVIGGDDDSGIEHELILKHQHTGKFYCVKYNSWDIDNTVYDEEKGIITGRCDLPSIMMEVKPKKVTVIKYV